MAQRLVVEIEEQSSRIGGVLVAGEVGALLEATKQVLQQLGDAIKWADREAQVLEKGPPESDSET